MILPSAAVLLPLTILALTSLTLLLLAAYFPGKRIAGATAEAGLLLAFLSSAMQFKSPPAEAASLFIVDSQVRFFFCLITFCAAAVCLLTMSYPAGAAKKSAELFTVLVTATLGAGSIISSTNFVAFFIGIEILSVSIFVLCSYLRSPHGLEAAFKYLVLSSVSSTFLLFGIALLYFQSGTLALKVLFESRGNLYATAGVSLVALGIAFKVALVPLHMWAPDIYQGAPAPVSAFIATVSKAALFAFILRHLSTAAGNTNIERIVTVAAISSMFAGNILGLLQDNVKRLLAYSSIAQAGYALVALQATGAVAREAASFYLAAYFISVLGAFGVISILSKEGREFELLSDFRGLASHRPFVALIFAIMLFSLAGIPLTAGFVGKFYIMSAGVNSNLWLLLFSLAASSVIGLFYYLRVIITMYTYAPSEDPFKAPFFRYPAAASLVLSALALLVLLFGIYPSPLIELVSVRP